MANEEADMELETDRRAADEWKIQMLKKTLEWE